ncbi:hypothetical protein [Kitasatospora sp. NPDC093679]|uniref:hypothetical protein n=1 Tax=Kitasatospora sp. NPDC093679 TaxID=3154983 RepID=UPI00341CC3A2
MVQQVDIEAFTVARTAGALVLDLREAFEFAAGHVSGVRWILSACLRAASPVRPVIVLSW